MLDSCPSALHIAWWRRRFTVVKASSTQLFLLHFWLMKPSGGTSGIANQTVKSLKHMASKWNPHGNTQTVTKAEDEEDEREQRGWFSPQSLPERDLGLYKMYLPTVPSLQILFQFFSTRVVISRNSEQPNPPTAHPQAEWVTEKVSGDWRKSGMCHRYMSPQTLNVRCVAKDVRACHMQIPSLPFPPESRNSTPPPGNEGDREKR